MAPSDNLRQETISGVGWSGIMQLTRQVIQLALTVVLARLLLPSAYGLVGMVIVFTGFAEIVRDLGFGAALIQRTDLQECHIRGAFWLNVMAGALLTLGFFFAAPLIAGLYKEPNLVGITQGVSLTFFISSLSLVQSSLLRRWMRFRLLFLIDAASLTGSGIIAVAAAANGLGAWSLVAQMLTYALLTSILTVVACDWRVHGAPSLRGIRDLWRFSLNLLGFNTVNYFTRNSDNLLIGRFVGPSALGDYSRAYNLMLLPITQVSSVITLAMFPALSRIHDDIPRVREIYLSANRLIGVVTIPPMAALVVVARPFVLTLLGPHWVGVIPILQVLCLSGITQGVAGTVGWIYTSLGRTDVMFKWGLVSSTVTVASFVIGVHWGAIGVAWGYFVSGWVILWYPSWYIPGRLIGLRVREMMANLKGIFLATVPTTGAVLLCSFVLPDGWPPLILLAIEGGCGLAVFWLIARAFRLRAYADLVAIVKEQLRLRRTRRAAAVASKNRDGNQE